MGWVCLTEGLKRALIDSLRDLVLITSLLENEPGYCHLFFSRPPSPTPYRFATIIHTDVLNRKLKLHLRAHTLSYCSNVIVWMETGPHPCVACKSLLRVRESVCTCARSASCSWADNTYPLLQGPGREGGEATAGSQWAKPTRGCQGARQTKMAASPVLVHLTDKLTATVHIWWIQRAAFPEID